jgi:hypothetical protein
VLIQHLDLNTGRSFPVLVLVLLLVMGEFQQMIRHGHPGQSAPDDTKFARWYHWHNHHASYQIYYREEQRKPPKG